MSTGMLLRLSFLEVPFSKTDAAWQCDRIYLLSFTGLYGRTAHNYWTRAGEGKPRIVSGIKIRPSHSATAIDATRTRATSFCVT
jgi:hypothetical protein